MVTYDSKLIYAFADRLYQQAQRIVVSYTLGWGLMGALLGGSAGALLNQGQGPVVGLGLVAAVLFAVVGYTQGQAKAFVLRLEAQRALCLVAIEENTRKVPAPA